MKRVIFLCFLVPLFCSCNEVSVKDSGDDFVAECITIPENATPVTYTGYIHIKGDIDSIQGNFILDTGAGGLYLDSTFVSENTFDFKDNYYSSISGIGLGFRNVIVIADSVSLSFDKFKSTTSSIPILNLKPIGGDFIDGLIGKDFFMQNVLEINYAKEYINIFESVDSIDLSDYSVVSMARIDNYFCMELGIKINAATTIEGMFIIDTGMPFSTFTSSVAGRYDLNANIERKVRYYTDYAGIGGASSGYDFIVDSLNISDYSLGNVSMSFSADQSGVLAGDSYMGIIGNNLLDRFDVVFDFNNSNLYLKPNEYFNSPYIFDRIGFSYVNRSETQKSWIVTGITENSPAENAGLKIDDRIISINEFPVEEISYRQQKGFFDELDNVRFVIRRIEEAKIIEFELSPLLN